MPRALVTLMVASFAVVVCACSGDESQPAGPASGGAAGTGGDTDGGWGGFGGQPKELPFDYQRPEQGDPLSDGELEAATDQYLELLASLRYFDFIAERAHGWPESDPQGRYWFATWWSGVTVVKDSGAVSYRHGEKGGDNNGLRTAPIMQSACYAHLLWGGAERERLVRALMRGHTAWILAMQRQPNDPAGTLLCRAFYPESVSSSDGGRDVFIDYSLNRPGIDADPSEYVQVPDNPHWGDIWIKNKRSKDDIGHMLRAIAQLDSCQGTFASSEAAVDLAELYDRYRAWCRQVEDDDWTIASLDKSGEFWLPPDLLANFVDIANAECTSMLAIRLMGRGQIGELECGNGIGPVDDAIMGATDHNGNIVRSFHEAAANAALLASEPDLAKALLEGLAERIVQGLDGLQGSGTPVPYLDDAAQVDLMVQAASVGVPLTWREVRYLHARIAEAHASFLDAGNDAILATFEATTPDGAYAYSPSGTGIRFRHLGSLLGACAAQYRNPHSKPLLDCDRIKSNPPQ